MPELTPRERQVLERVCRGLPTKTVAAELGVSEQAVKGHLSRLFSKFGVGNRAGLVGAAVSGASLKRHTADGEHAADLERQIVMLTARNAELETANSGLRSQVSGLGAAAG